jgi:hypothetical protein
LSFGAGYTVMVGSLTPVIRITRRPPTIRLLSVVVSFSSIAALSPGAPFGQMAMGFMAYKVDAAQSRHVQLAIRINCHCRAAGPPMEARRLRLAIGFVFI